MLHHGPALGPPPPPPTKSDDSRLLAQILEEQRKTNQLLLMLIEAMGQEEADPDAEPVTYMDGTKVS